MPDLFQRVASNLGGVFTSDRAKLNMGADLSVLVQQMNATYAQTITRLYEVGGNRSYYIGGRTQGQIQLNRVVGPTATVKAFYRKFGDVCKARGNNIELELTETDCSGNGGVGGGSIKYLCKHCVIQQVSIGVQAQDMIINESSSMIFMSMEVS